ncbi:DUF5658 family protein [Halobellus ordinarius]|uniref:DUF5658 family protein n=1 Tax=Halobellus ordinarius TaxID=3075120 RepID=UPI00288010C5|nr:DUF5658 family protein [Halobellus sp. ZY16]
MPQSLYSPVLKEQFIAMSGHAVELNGRVDQWWFWFAVALFLLIPVDLFTTLLAVGRYGTGVEANPVMRWLLEQGLFVGTVANLLAVGVAVWLFHVAIDRVSRVSPSYRFACIRLVDVWIGLLIAVGLVVVANNLLSLV